MSPPLSGSRWASCSHAAVEPRPIIVKALQTLGPEAVVGLLNEAHILAVEEESAEDMMDLLASPPAFIQAR